MSQTDYSKKQSKERRKHLVVPDIQAHEGSPLAHCKALGKLILKEKPDVIVFLGDVWDFPSISTHSNKGNVHYHNKSYVTDLEAGIKAMEACLSPMFENNKKLRQQKMKQYKPRLVFTMGNHEYRRNRLEANQPELLGALPTPEKYLWDKGFEVYPYKQAVRIDGINYCHLCPATHSDRAVEKANLILQKRHESWTVGHTQTLDYCITPHYPRHQAIVAGAFYLHDEPYKTGSNDHWRGIILKHNVTNGTYDPEFVSIDRLLSEYGGENHE